LILTFVDAGVLIAAARGTTDISGKAMELLDDDKRTFASSDFVRLEVLPKPMFHKRQEEAAFYGAFFEAAGRSTESPGWWSEPSIRDSPRKADVRGAHPTAGGRPAAGRGE